MVGYNHTNLGGIYERCNYNTCSGIFHICSCYDVKPYKVYKQEVFLQDFLFFFLSNGKILQMCPNNGTKILNFYGFLPTNC